MNEKQHKNMSKLSGAIVQMLNQGDKVQGLTQFLEKAMFDSFVQIKEFNSCEAFTPQV